MPQIIIGVVIPVTVVAIAGVAATAMLQWQKRRRRRFPKAYWWEGGEEVCVSAHSANGGKGRVASLPAAAAIGDAKESGCVFLGLEEDQQPPEWSALAADLVGLASTRVSSKGRETGTTFIMERREVC